MKKLIGMMLLCATMVLSFASCSNENDDFDYPIEMIYGKWEGVGVFYNGKWLDLTDWMYQELAFSIRFNEDGTYYGEGFFGNGYGTYKAVGKNIITYIDGQKYFTYQIKSLTADNAEITMLDNSGDTMDIRVRKVK